MNCLGELDLSVARKHGCLADQETDQAVEDSGTPRAIREQKFTYRVHFKQRLGH